MRHNSHWAKWEREMKWDLNGIQQEARSNSIYYWTKISSLEIKIFDLNLMVKSGSEFFILKRNEPLQRYIHTTGQFSTLLHWEAATLKGQSEFQNNKKNLDHFSPSF